LCALDPGVKARVTVSNMRTHTSFEQYVELLRKYAAREGHTRVPISHIEELDGRPIKLGSWVSYIRHRQRRGGLEQPRVEILSGLPGWQWGPLPPGPATKHGRDREILEKRSEGLSLRQIADSYGISRQRVHQIVTGVTK